MGLKVVHRSHRRRVNLSHEFQLTYLIFPQPSRVLQQQHNIRYYVTLLSNIHAHEMNINIERNASPIWLNLLRCLRALIVSLLFALILVDGILTIIAAFYLGAWTIDVPTDRPRLSPTLRALRIEIVKSSGTFSLIYGLRSRYVQPFTPTGTPNASYNMTLFLPLTVLSVFMTSYSDPALY